jgi:predicted nucleic acid-binding protein
MLLTWLQIEVKLLSLFFPDTSTLISLFDEDEPLHSRASEIIRKYRVGEVFVPMSVQAEWQSRSVREHNRLVINTAIFLDNKRKEGKESINIGEFNTIVDNAANKIRNEPSIEPRKLDRARFTLQKEISNFYKNSYGVSAHSKSIADIKEYMMKLSYTFFERGTGVITFFVQHGYSHPDIPEEIEKKVKMFISQQRIDMETQDAMILSDLIRYVAADGEVYDFVVGDKKFYKKGKKYVDSYDSVKGRINFVLLGAPLL